MDTINTGISTAIQDKILAVTRQGRTREEATDWFRVAVGLYYLAGLMTRETIDFKRLDREYNRFVYQSIGSGHTITSILQFMSGKKVLPVLESERFLGIFAAHCSEVPPDSIPFLVELNLGVAKDISKIEVAGPVHDWLQRHKQGGPDQGI
ncbi:hypothetical protein [Massilia sp. 9096]|jgi:hypothetical protein|uniref:hypothetical protein n=1 Tax=Massilia sp. 9096 TaxID=1500894 RepID=UPI00068BD48B|nr:hypothetical protein [Massilia sp. 9096]